MLRGSVAGLGALAALSIAGCGGSSGSSSSSSYTLSSTQSCLSKAGYQAAAVKNASLPGTGGNLRVKLAKQAALLNPNAPRGGNQTGAYVFLVFGKDPTEALGTEKKAVALAVKSIAASFGSITPAAVRAGVGVTKNVFYYSTTGPLTKSQRLKVTSCLR
jgi:hypothetical protein